MVIKNVEAVKPQRRSGNPTADGDFVVFEHVAIFDEHTGDDGVEYDERLLSRIAENCNRRIQTTGDFCPIVVGHTRDEKDKQHANDDPPVIGLAGPFYVGDWVNGDGQPVKCIFTTCWVFPDCEQTFLRNPRRSVEVWPESKPEERYFDPLAVLGSETPKRDLGMIYAKNQYAIPGPFRYSKRSVFRYEESVPGGNNTFIPGPVKPRRNEKGGGMLSQDELQQIIEAMRPIVGSMVDAALPTSGGEPGQEDSLSPIAPEQELTPEPELAPEAELAPESPLEPEGDVMPELPPELSEEDQSYARGLGRQYMKYSCGDGADKYAESIDDEDRRMVDHYMRYMCDDDDRKQKYMAKPFSFEAVTDQMQKNSKSPIGGDDLTEKPGDSSPSGSMNASEHKPGKATKNSKSSEAIMPDKKPEEEVVVEPVADEKSDEKQKYAKTLAENRDLKTELDDIKQKYAKHEEQFQKLQVRERYAKRQARLIEKESEGFILDVEEELAATDEFSDEMFDKHIDERIPARYQKMPTDSDTFDVGQRKPAKMATASPKDKQDRFAGKASQIAEKYRKGGKKVSSHEYGKILDLLVEHDGEFDEDAHTRKVFSNGAA